MGAGCAFGCARPEPALYPSWEPTSSLVPAIESRALARAHLEESHRIWREHREFGGRDYTYVRAMQVSREEVRFTVLVVRGERVVERALLSTRLDGPGLWDRWSGKEEERRALELLWWERGRSVGAHAEGAAALTLDELYAVCRDEVLAARPELTPRLYFHRNGVLQHCGFSIEECGDCPAVSVQSVEKFVPKAWQEPKDMLCVDRQGVFVAGAEPFVPADCELCTCEERNRSDPREGMRAPWAPLEQAGLESICRIDPAACPAPARDVPAMGTWLCKHLLSADCVLVGPVVRDPLCTGRPHPTKLEDAWLRTCRPRAH